MTLDPDGARRHLETTADLVVVHDVMAAALTDLWGIYGRAAGRCVEGSPDYVWWLAQAGAVAEYKRNIDVRDRAAMLAALDRATIERERARSVTAA